MILNNTNSITSVLDGWPCCLGECGTIVHDPLHFYLILFFFILFYVFPLGAGIFPRHTNVFSAGQGSLKNAWDLNSNGESGSWSD